MAAILPSSELPVAQAWLDTDELWGAGMATFSSRIDIYLQLYVWK